MKKLFLSAVMALLFAAVIFLFPKDTEFITHTFFAMGTIVQVILPKEYAVLSDDIHNLMDNLTDMILSDISKVSFSKDYVEIDKITYELLNRESEFKKASPEFGVKANTVSSLYGFPSGPFKVPDKNILKKAIADMRQSDFETIEISGKYYARADSISLDLGAYAKGYIADEAALYLLKNNVADFLINAGGDIYANGSKNGKKWSLGVTDPKNRDGYTDIVYLKNKAIATSGNYERYFMDNSTRINHIFNAQTGRSVNRYDSVSVIADDACTADGFATVYYLLEPAEIEDVCSVNSTSVLLIKDGQEIKLCGWEDYYNK